MGISRNRVIVVSALGGALFLAGCVAARLTTVDPPGSMDGRHAVPSINPDPRVRWWARGVAGYRLCRPDTCITLPPGATLWLPEAVADEDTL